MGLGDLIYDNTVGEVKKGVSEAKKGYDAANSWLDANTVGEAKNLLGDADKWGGIFTSSPGADPSELRKMVDYPPKGKDPEKEALAKYDKTTLPPPEESDYEKLANAQADQYLAMTKALDPLVSGSALGALDSGASNQAEANLGQSSTSPMSQWLNQQTGAAAATAAPTNAAMGQLEKAETLGEGFEGTALKQLGTAETAMMNSAPYEQLLTSLAGEVPYDLAKGYSPPDWTTANTPGWLQSAFKNADVTTLGASKGSTDAAKGLLPPPPVTTTVNPPTNNQEIGPPSGP